MTIASQADLVTALPGQLLRYVQTSAVACRIWSDLWQLMGYPLPGTDPTAIGSGGAIPTSASLGAFQELRNAGAGKQLYFYGQKSALNNTSMRLMLVDRLWHGGSVLGNVITSQAVTGPGALTRPDANGEGAEVWLAIGSSAWGGTATTITVSYVNSTGTGGTRTGTITVPSSNALQNGNMFPMRFQAGDTGVRSISAVQLSPSTGTAGNATIMIIRKVAILNMSERGRVWRLDPIGATLAPIYNNAALFFMMMSDGSNSNSAMSGSLQIVEA